MTQIKQSGVRMLRDSARIHWQIIAYLSKTVSSVQSEIWLVHIALCICTGLGRDMVMATDPSAAAGQFAGLASRESFVDATSPMKGLE
jgi:hypothetical protein